MPSIIPLGATTSAPGLRITNYRHRAVIAFRIDESTDTAGPLCTGFLLPNGSRLAHLDAYRIDSIPEAEDLDIDAYLVDGPLVVEWSDRIMEALPVEHLEVALSWVADEQRRLLFTPRGEHYEKLLKDFRRLAFGG